MFVDRQVLPDVLRLREPGVRAAVAAEDAQLAAALEVLPLVVLALRRRPLPHHHVHLQLVLRHRRATHRARHLQVHRVQGVSAPRVHRVQGVSVPLIYRV